MQQDFYNQIYSYLTNSTEVVFNFQSHADNLVDSLASLEKLFSDKTSIAVKKMKQFTNGFHVYWKYRNEQAGIIHGEMNICHPYTAFVNNDASQVIYTLPDEPDFLCYIDNHPKIADDVYTLAAIDDNTGDIILGYSDGGRCNTLSISWEEYHSCLLLTLGYPHWQLFFATELSQDQIEWLSKIHFQKMKDEMQICFPNNRMDIFTALIKSKNSKFELG